MNSAETVVVDPKVGRMRIPRSRGAFSGLLLVALGVVGALIAFVGPYFAFSWDTTQPWVWTAARGWLEVLPGAVTVLGGLLLVASRNRATAMLGGWLAVVAGVWFIVGRDVATLVDIDEVGPPVAATAVEAALLDLVYFSGLGALIVYLGATAVGRLSVRSLRDIRYAEKTLAAEHGAADGYGPADPAVAPGAAPATGSVPSSGASQAEPLAPHAEPAPESGTGRRRGLLRRS